MEPAAEDAQLTLEYLRAWRNRFKKSAERTKNVGSATWLRILNTLLDDPVACENWLKLPDAQAQAAELARLAAKCLYKELSNRNR
jgi:hypothetical protein